MKYSVVSRGHQGQGEFLNEDLDRSLTLVFFRRLGCEIDHPGALGGQHVGCIAPNGLGCNHSAGALSGQAGRTGCSRPISCVQTQYLSIQSKSFFC